jgi:hypothetical protein
MRVPKELPSSEGKLISWGIDDFWLPRMGRSLRVSLLDGLAVRLLPERRSRRCSVALVETCNRSTRVSSSPIDPLATVVAVVIMSS